MLEIHNEKLASVEQIQKGFAEHGYICSRSIATAVYVACQLGKPILVEGPAGVGKTELANTTAEYPDLPLLRMQCYEGLDDAKAPSSDCRDGTWVVHTCNTRWSQ